MKSQRQKSQRQRRGMKLPRAKSKTNRSMGARAPVALPRRPSPLICRRLILVASLAQSHGDPYINVLLGISADRRGRNGNDDPARGRSIRRIAQGLERSPSTVSREIRRNGGCSAYRASEADKRDWRRALRPKPCRLARHAELRWRVARKLVLQWLAATVFAEGNRSLALLSGVSEQDRAAAQSTPAEDLGLRNPCR